MFPTLLRWGDFRVATYGVLAAAGYLAAVSYLSARRSRMGLGEKEFWGLIYALFLGALVGGKLLFWAVEWRALASGALHPLKDLRYGFVFYGGVAGALAAGLLYCRRKGLAARPLSDYFGVAVPLGHGIGRLGCLAAGCCAGKATALPWGVRFGSPECLVDPALLGVPLHPVQLYEAGADFLIAAACARRLGAVQRGTAAPGGVFLLYVALYAVVRFALEFLRGDARGALGPLSVSQWIALAAFAAAAAALRRPARGA